MSKEKTRSLFSTILFGLASVILYGLLLAYSDRLVDLAQRAHHGEKMLFLVPVAVAFLFSWIHGHFTGHFWEFLGVRAASGDKH